MLECRACTWRAIRAIAGDAFPTSSSVIRPLALTPHISNRPFRKTIATTAKRDEQSQDALSGVAPIERTPQHKPTSNKSGPIVVQNEKALQLELTHLKDPVKLANHVHYTLRCDKPEKALDLCRLASKDMEVIVSWNHVIDYNVSKGKVNDAIKIFNEMKKRGQFPDSYTYTRIFSGIAQAHRNAAAQKYVGWNEALRKDFLAKALSIYNGMFSPTSRVQPTIIHTNAVLRLCSLAKDMDAAWGVIAKMPESGPGAANQVTYTILLGALKFSGMSNVSAERDGGDDEPADEKVTSGRVMQRSIDDGKRIWKDIITKWKAADIQLDEQLIVAMGSLLLSSSRMEDWDDVLNLVHQTTRLERLVAPLGTPERNSQHVPVRQLEEPEEDEDGWTPVPANDAFKLLPSSDREGNSRTKQSPGSWVKPGNGILNILVEACTNMREPKTAQAYWDKLTTEYDVVPDLNNFHQILSLLKINRSSYRAVNLVKDVHERGTEVKPKTYLLAMATCQRDWKNHNIVDIATRLLDDMEKRMAYPVTPVLDSYLSIALQKEEGSKIVRALDRLDSFVHVLRSLVTYGAEKMRTSELVKAKEEAVDFMRAMIGAIDVMMQRGLVPREDFKNWHQRRSQLNAFVGRQINSLAAQRAHVEARRQQRQETDEMTSQIKAQWEERLQKKLKTESKRIAYKHVYVNDEGVDTEHLLDQGREVKHVNGHMGPHLKHVKPWFTPAARAVHKLRARNHFDRTQRQSSASRSKYESDAEDDEARIERAKQWRVPQVEERLGGLSKWRLPQSQRDRMIADELRSRYAEPTVAKDTAFLEKKEQRQMDREKEKIEKMGYEFEAADSPMDLAMK